MVNFNALASTIIQFYKYDGKLDEREILRIEELYNLDIFGREGATQICEGINDNGALDSKDNLDEFSADDQTNLRNIIGSKPRDARNEFLARLSADAEAAREFAAAVDSLRTLRQDLAADKAAFDGTGPAHDTAGRYSPADVAATHPAFARLGELRTSQAELASLNSRLGQTADAPNANGSLYAQRKAAAVAQIAAARSGDPRATGEAKVKLDAVNAEIARLEPRRAALAQEVRILELEARQAALPGEITALETQIDNVRYELGDSCKADPTGARSPSPGVDVTAKRTELAGLVGRLRGLQSELSSGATELARLKAAGTP